MKIQAWENHQKEKTEAEMRKIEVFDNFFCSIAAKVFLFFFLILFYLLKNWLRSVGKGKMLGA